MCGPVQSTALKRERERKSEGEKERENYMVEIFLKVPYITDHNRILNKDADNKDHSSCIRCEFLKDRVICYKKELLWNTSSSQDVS